MSILKFSEAFSLGIHSVKIIKSKNEKVSLSYLAEELNGSEAHLSKVMQRLVKAGIVQSTRGPKGGFEIAQDKISFLRIYEIIEGEFPQGTCMFAKPACTGGNCLLGDLICKVNKEVFEYLKNNLI